MIHIRELNRLGQLKNLRLIAGKGGTERTVTAAVLFEYDPSRVQLPDFYRGDLVVTTLAYARGDAELLSQSLRMLLGQGIAGLLVKTAYFQTLPEEIIRLADRLDTPIYLFDETYIEEVILQVTDLIRGVCRFDGYEQDIDLLMQGTAPVARLREAADRVCPTNLTSWQILAIMTEHQTGRLDDGLMKLMEAEPGFAVQCMAWRQMRLLLCPTEAEMTVQQLEHLTALLGIPESYIGVSTLQSEHAGLGDALCEAIYAARAGQLEGRPWFHAEEMGIYAYLLPASENRFVRERCRRTVGKIRAYDVRNHANLEATAAVYIQAHLNIADAAKLLYQHPNTVRYRLARLKQLLEIEEDAQFDNILEQTFLLYKIIERESI